MDTVYLEFTAGIDDAGQPEPLVEIGLPVQIARQITVDGRTEVVDDYLGVTIRPSAKPDAEIPGRIVPNTRIVATRAPGVMEHLLGRGDFRLTDPPGRKATAGTADHRASRQRRARNRTEE